MSTRRISSLLCIFLFGCEPAPADHSAAAGIGAPAPSQAIADGAWASAASSAPATVPLARVEGYGNPATGELWIRALPPESFDQSDAVAVQAHAVSSFCSEDAEGLGADHDPDTHPTGKMEFYTVPEPGGCEDNDLDGEPDDIPQVCNDGNYGGVAFNAFDQTLCEMRLPGGDPTLADARVAAEDPLALDHSSVFGDQGVGCARQRIGNYTGKNFSRVMLDIDVFNGDATHYPYGYPYALGEDVDATPSGTAVGAVETPTTGRGRPAQALGLWDFGPMADGESVDMWVYFRNGDTNDFRFSGYILGEIAEQCGDSDDDDCDGVVDNGCGTLAVGGACYHDDDCQSGICSGASIVSLLGAAAVPGISTLADDVAGACQPVCGDGVVEGAEQCDYGDATPGDGCSDSCQWESGNVLPGWGPTRIDDGGIEEVRALLQVSSGVWLLGGSTEFGAGDPDWTITRTNADGTHDTGFGFLGFSDRLHFAPGTQEGIRCLGRQSGGALVASGIAGDGVDFPLARWDAAGGLDTSFGNVGSTVTDFGDSEGAGDCVVLSDDRILVLGWSHNGSDDDLRLVMYTPDGQVDVSWGLGAPGVSGVGALTAVDPTKLVDGETFSIGVSSFEFDVAGDGVGGGIAVDVSAAVNANDVAAAMYAAIAGNLATGLRARVDNDRIEITHSGAGTTAIGESVADATFVVASALGGSVVLDTGVSERGHALALGAGSEIVVVGEVTGVGSLVARFDAAGQLDTASFAAPNGFAVLGGQSALDVVLDGSDALLVGDEGSGNAFVARVTSSGALDTGFDGDGVHAVAGGILHGVLLDGGGNVLAAGARGSDALLVRLSASTGAPDASFGSGGEATDDVTGGVEALYDIGLEAGGFIVAAGIGDGTDQDQLVFRYAP